MMDKLFVSYLSKLWNILTLWGVIFAIQLVIINQTSNLDLKHVFLCRQVCPHQAQLGRSIQRRGHDHPRNCQRLKGECFPDPWQGLNTAFSSSFSRHLSAAMIILSATGDQTQIVLRSADMSSPVTCIFVFSKLSLGSAENSLCIILSPLFVNSSCPLVSLAPQIWLIYSAGIWAKSATVTDSLTVMGVLLFSCCYQWFLSAIRSWSLPEELSRPWDWHHSCHRRLRGQQVLSPKSNLLVTFWGW